MLLEAGADKDAAREDGSAALYFAAAEGHLEVVRLLLEAGADKETAREDGSTALCLRLGKAAWQLCVCCSKLR